MVSSVKKYDGKEVFPVMYISRKETGISRYMSAQDSKGVLIKDKSGFPVKWKEV